MSSPKQYAAIDAVMQDDLILENAGRAAVREALLDHKRTGDPIVVCQNRQVVWIPADKIEIDAALDQPIQ